MPEHEFVESELRLVDAALESLGELKCLLEAECRTNSKRGASALRSSRNPAEASVSKHPPADGVCQFGWTGRDWKVVFSAGGPIYLPDTLGARYLDYLLHHPNVAITAFDLEVTIQTEKGEARSRNSLQPESDSQARRQYRQALRALEAEREMAQAAGDREGIERLDEQIEPLHAALQGSAADDSGERARNNVRHAVQVVSAQLRRGGPVERAFAEHLRAQLSIGYECLYVQSQGLSWTQA